MMEEKVRRGEGGQVLVQVALGLVVLLLAAGLAIDGGNVYGERRSMQNAADAGALAGARVLSEGGNESAVTAAAENYAIARNGADSADVDVDMNAGTVEVTAGREVETFLMGLADLDTVDVGSLAVAEVYSPPGFPAIISFDEGDGDVRISGNVGLEGGQQLIVHSNLDLNVDGNAAVVTPKPEGTYVGTLDDHPAHPLYGETRRTKPISSPLWNFRHEDVDDDSSLEDEIDRLRDEGDLDFKAGSQPKSDNFKYLSSVSKHGQDVSVPDSSGPGVIYIDDDIKLVGNSTLRLKTYGGLIIVNGYFKITGNQNLDLDGLLYTTGYLELGGTPDSINGGLWSEEDVWFHGTPDSFVTFESVEVPMPPLVRLIR